jgi:hypothetical protein
VGRGHVRAERCVCVCARVRVCVCVRARARVCVLLTPAKQQVLCSKRDRNRRDDRIGASLQRTRRRLRAL